MTVQIDWNAAADADLVGAAAAGDRAAFAGIYDRYADRLYDFCLGMVGDRDAADCVQEAFVMAATDLPALRDPDKLRPWLYSIARHQALRALRARKREMTSDELPDNPSADAGPDVLAARNELADLVAEAEGGLSDRDREVLNLAYRHGLVGSELAQALGVSTESAKKMVQRLRDTVEKSLGALLVVRHANSGHNMCAELAAITAGWGGQFTILLRKRISRHIESCPDCDYERSRLVNPRALLGTSAVLVPAPAWLRHQTLSRVELGGASAGVATHVAGHAATRMSLLAGRFALLAVAVVAVPAVAWGLMVGAPGDAPVSPSRVHVTTSVATPPQASTSVAPPSSVVPAPPPNITTPQPSPVAPPSGPANTEGPAVDDRATQPAPSAAAVPTEDPQAPAVAPTTRNAPAAHPSKPPSASRPQRPSQPPLKRCSDGSLVAGGQSCPTPTPSPSPQGPCPRAAVPGNPVCGQKGSGG
jgi:RNA polymerase sigma factor (sigma-70 family)